MGFCKEIKRFFAEARRLDETPEVHVAGLLWDAADYGREAEHDSNPFASYLGRVFVRIAPDTFDPTRRANNAMEKLLLYSGAKPDTDYFVYRYVIERLAKARGYELDSDPENNSAVFKKVGEQLLYEYNTHNT